MNRATLSSAQPYLIVDEREPDGHGGQVSVLTVFLTASQCPIGCSMCDLHHNTLLTATPVGAIPRQLDHALYERPRLGWIKLYNSGNFFDPRSIPVVDYPDIAARCAGFSRVIVENHPRFGAERLRQFRDLLNCSFEVAVGLETVQPRWLARLEKQMSRDDFDRYARWLGRERVDLRVFLIVGVPGSGVAESIRWARLSLRHAVQQGARHISLIPARSGHGWHGMAAQLPTFSLDDLLELQAVAIEDSGPSVVTIDLWNLDERDWRFQRLNERNLAQHLVSVPS
jgi:archaeosine synthase beta-subunit